MYLSVEYDAKKIRIPEGCVYYSILRFLPRDASLRDAHPVSAICCNVKLNDYKFFYDITCEL